MGTRWLHGTTHVKGVVLLFLVRSRAGDRCDPPFLSAAVTTPWWIIIRYLTNSSGRPSYSDRASPRDANGRMKNKPRAVKFEHEVRTDWEHDRKERTERARWGLVFFGLLFLSCLGLFWVGGSIRPRLTSTSVDVRLVTEFRLGI